MDKVREDATSAKETVTDEAKKQAESGVEQTAEQVEGLSAAVDQVASSLSDNDVEGLAAYARQTSEKLSTFAGHLQGRSVDELASDAKKIAHENPTAFLLGSVALGFGLSRFLKASQDLQYSDTEEDHTAVTDSNRQPEVQTEFTTHL